MATFIRIIRHIIPMWMSGYHGGIILRPLHRLLANHIMFRIILCISNTAADVDVNTTAGLSYRDPSIAAIDSASKVGTGSSS